MLISFGSIGYEKSSSSTTPANERRKRKRDKRKPSGVNSSMHFQGAISDHGVESRG